MLQKIKVNTGSRSVAEDFMFFELQKRGLNIGLKTNADVFVSEKQKKKYGVSLVNVDFLWNSSFLAVFLDGWQIHSRLKQEARDGKIDLFLQGLGYEVLRFSYLPPISKQRIQEICDEIQETFKEKVKETTEK